MTDADTLEAILELKSILEEALRILGEDSKKRIELASAHPGSFVAVRSQVRPSTEAITHEC